MDRFANCLALIGLVTCIGCGPGPQVAERSSSTLKPTASQPVLSAPTDVVSQFLDEVRRGGKDSNANGLLTERARSELKRIGRSVQPIGSPDAGFVVTRAELVPGDENSALVHSVWSEPDGTGTLNEYQVVWAVQQEAGAWRISGLAMELAPNQDPVIIDFENGNLMAKLLATPESMKKSSGIKSQAPASNPAISQ